METGSTLDESLALWRELRRMLDMPLENYERMEKLLSLSREQLFWLAVNLLVNISDEEMERLVAKKREKAPDVAWTGPLPAAPL